MVKFSKLNALIGICTIFCLFGCANSSNMKNNPSSIFESSSFDDFKVKKGGNDNPNDFFKGKTFSYETKRKKFKFRNDGTAIVYSYYSKNDGTDEGYYLPYGIIVYKIDNKEFITDFTHIYGRDGFIGKTGELIEKNVYLKKYIDLAKNNESFLDSAYFGVSEEYYKDYSIALMNTLISPVTRYNLKKENNKILISEIPNEVKSFPQDLINFKIPSDFQEGDFYNDIFNTHDAYLGGNWSDNNFPLINRETKKIIQGTWKKKGTGKDQEFTITVNGENYFYKINEAVYREGELVQLNS